MANPKKKTGKRHLFSQGAAMLAQNADLSTEPSSDRFDLQTIRVDEVVPDPDNPRHFGYRAPRLDEIKLGAEHVRQTTEDTSLANHLAQSIDDVLALAASLKEHKQVQPIAVFKDRGTYRIIAGETRWLAHQINGTTSIDAKVYLEKPADLRARQYAENANRSSISLLGETEAVRRLFDRPVQEFAGIGMSELVEVAAMPRRKAKRWAAILRHQDVVNAIYDKVLQLRSSAERLGAIQDDAERAAALTGIRKDGDRYAADLAAPSMLEPASAARKQTTGEKKGPGRTKTVVVLGRVPPGVAGILLEQLADFADLDIPEDADAKDLEDLWKAVLAKAQDEAKKER